MTDLVRKQDHRNHRAKASALDCKTAQIPYEKRVTTRTTPSAQNKTEKNKKAKTGGAEQIAYISLQAT